MSIRKTYCNLIALAVINKDDKGAVVQIYGPFKIFLVDGSSETELFGHLSNHVFGVRNFRDTRYMMASFFRKINVDSKNSKKKWEKVICFWGNCISIDTAKICLLRTGYLSLAANVLTSSPQNWYVNKWDLLQLSWLESDREG